MHLGTKLNEHLVFAPIITILIVMMGFVACNSNERADYGEPCSREDDTLCDSLCLLDIPNGMCSHDCADDETVCPEGSVCAAISGGRYCLDACEEDDDCRDDMICVVGVCRGEGGFSDECGESDDCRSGICHDGACSQTCNDHGDCPEGATCLDVGAPDNLCLDLDFGEECETHDDCGSGICHDGSCNLECHHPDDCVEGLACIDTGDGVPLCLEYDPPAGGESEYGESCTFADCADGFDCLSRTDDPLNDPYAYCTRSCLNALDCPADMTCRQTQNAGEEDVVIRCVPRGYCERCAYDAQCATGDDRCVSQDPRQGPGRYCSQTCNIDNPVTSCPTDSTCHEALWCAPDRAWVADCEWCSDPEQCGSADGDPLYQCFHDYGACSGNAEDYCSPCFTDADCPSGGQCWHDPYFANSFCTAPCEEDGGRRTCPEEHMCVQFGLAYQNDYQCMPRQGSCSDPSGGLRTCSGCSTNGDCLSGFCLPENITAGTGAQVCWEDCSGGDSECPPYTQCLSFTDGDGNPVYLCGARDDFFNCSEVAHCLRECPEGPDSCSDDARTYCFD